MSPVYEIFDKSTPLQGMFSVFFWFSSFAVDKLELTCTFHLPTSLAEDGAKALWG